MHLPKFSILHGVLLDIERRNLFKSKNLPGYPSIEEVVSNVVHLNLLWNSINKDNFILKRLTELTGVELHRDIEVYVIGGGLGAAGMSEPFIIATTDKDHKTFSDQAFVDLLVHETAHRFVGDVITTPRLKSTGT